MIISLVALFVTLGGTSYAAITLAPKNSVGSAQVINGSLLKKDLNKKTIAALKGNRGARGPAGAAGAAGAAGPAGPAGPAGATGAAGAAGAAGATGPAGPFPATLPSGKTLTGQFGVSGIATGAGQRAEEGISFAFPFAAAPTPHVIAPGGAATAQCPGSFANPQAAGGHLCVYESQRVNVGTDCVYSGLSVCDVATKYGGVMFINAAGAGPFYTEGTWAATAP
jgi:hypothetical protein